VGSLENASPATISRCGMVSGLSGCQGVRVSGCQGVRVSGCQGVVMGLAAGGWQNYLGRI